MPIRNYDIQHTNITKTFYAQCQQKMIEASQNNPDCISLYQFGNVSVPGNSDIDLLFVMRPVKKSIQKIFRFLETDLSPREKFVLYQHNPMIVSESIAKNINHIRPCSNLNYLSGKKIQFESITSKSEKLFILIDLLCHYYPNIFNQKKRTLRLQFQHINASRFPLEILKDLYSKKQLPAATKTWEAAIKQNQKLRLKHSKGQKNNYVEHLNTLEKIVNCSIIEIKTWLNQLILKENKNKSSSANTVARIKNRLFVSPTILKNSPNPLKIVRYDKYYQFWLQPIGFSIYFDNHQDKDIEKRKNIISSYCKFIADYTFGKNLYYPWWYGKESFLLKLRRNEATSKLRLVLSKSNDSF